MSSPVKGRISPEFARLLLAWADEKLASIGILSTENEKYAGWRDKVIEGLRNEYTDRAIELFLNPVRKRVPLDCDASAVLTGPCGDTVSIYLKIAGGRIRSAYFETDGCEPSVASCGMLTGMIEGMGLREAREVGVGDLLEALGGLPPEGEHCAVLAVKALRCALETLGADPGG